MRLSKNDRMSPAVHVCTERALHSVCREAWSAGVEGLEIVLPRFSGQHLVAATTQDRAVLAVRLVKVVDRSAVGSRSAGRFAFAPACDTFPEMADTSIAATASTRSKLWVMTWAGADESTARRAWRYSPRRASSPTTMRGYSSFWSGQPV